MSQYWKIINIQGLLLCCLQAAGAPAHVRELVGSYTVQQNGMLKLYHSPPANVRDSYWEDENRTVICDIKLNFDITLVDNCTRGSLTLKSCVEVTYFSYHNPDESKSIEVKFQINCTEIRAGIPEGTKVQPTWVVVLVLVLSAVAVAVGAYCLYRCVKRVCNRYETRGVAYTHTVQEETAEVKHHGRIEEASTQANMESKIHV
ncbi:uncharacterized protein ACB058_001442 [Synchiropus picturatus]